MKSLRSLSLVCFMALGTLLAQADPGAELRYGDAMARMKEAKTDYERWCALNAAAKESFNMGREAEAAYYALEMERLAPEYKKDWNYGNAIQDFNLVLGRLALQTGEIEVAKMRLVAAGQTPGSPQLDSFGPNLTLARDLLAKGEKATVLVYLESCRKFWAKDPQKKALDKMNDEQLTTWKTEIEAGKIPDFGAHLVF